MGANMNLPVWGPGSVSLSRLLEVVFLLNASLCIDLENLAFINIFQLCL